MHVLSAGLKAAATWTRVEVLQAARECCGGMGFLAANRIGPIKNDTDVDVTFEGDNTVGACLFCVVCVCEIFKARRAAAAGERLFNALSRALT